MIASLTRKPQFSYYTAEEQSSSVRVWFGLERCKKTHTVPATPSMPRKVKPVFLAHCYVASDGRLHPLWVTGARVSSELRDVAQNSWSLNPWASLWSTDNSLHISDICFHTLCFVGCYILFILRYRSWQWVRWDLHKDHVSPTLCPPTRSRVLRLSSSPRMIASLSDIPRLSLTSHITSAPVMVRTPESVSGNLHQIIHKLCCPTYWESLPAPRRLTTPNKVWIINQHTDTERYTTDTSLSWGDAPCGWNVINLLSCYLPQSWHETWWWSLMSVDVTTSHVQLTPGTRHHYWAAHIWWQL